MPKQQKPPTLTPEQIALDKQLTAALRKSYKDAFIKSFKDPRHKFSPSNRTFRLRKYDANAAGYLGLLNATNEMQKTGVDFSDLHIAERIAQEAKARASAKLAAQRSEGTGTNIGTLGALAIGITAFALITAGVIALPFAPIIAAIVVGAISQVPIIIGMVSDKIKNRAIDKESSQFGLKAAINYENDRAKGLSKSEAMEKALAPETRLNIPEKAKISKQKPVPITSVKSADKQKTQSASTKNASKKSTKTTKVETKSIKHTDAPAKSPEKNKGNKIGG